MAMTVGGGATSVGIPLGLGVIVSAILLTGIYVRRANGEFDEPDPRLRRTAADAPAFAPTRAVAAGRLVRACGARAAGALEGPSTQQATN